MVMVRLRGLLRSGGRRWTAPADRVRAPHESSLGADRTRSRQPSEDDTAGEAGQPAHAEGLKTPVAQEDLLGLFAASLVDEKSVLQQSENERHDRHGAPCRDELS